MANPWDEFQQQGGAPWEQAQETPRVGSGVLDAFTAGLQESAGGLVVRGKLPTVHLDHESSKWYERLAKGAGGVVGDVVPGIVGAVAGGAAGTAAAPGIGTALGAGAGGMGLPAAIREAYMQAYTKGEIQNSGDFLSRLEIVLTSTAKNAAIGAATFGAGRAAGIATTTAGLSRAASGVVGVTAEAGAATVTASALEGRLPDVQDFADTAMLIAGLKGVAATPQAIRGVSNTLAKVYATTGKSPIEVMADAKANNRILDDILNQGGKTETLTGVDAVSETRVQHSDIPQAYREEAARTAAVEAMPLDKLTAVLNKPFADIPSVKLPEGLNLKYVENFDHLAAFDARITEVFKPEIDAQRGGTQTWAETVAKGEDLLRTAAGQDAVNLVHREAGTADAAHVLHARGALMMKALTDAKEAATAYEKAAEADKPRLMAEALEAANKAVAFKSYFTGAASEAGRALQFLQYVKNAKAEADFMSKAIEAYNGKNPDMLLRAISKAQTLAEVTELAKAAAKPDWFDKYMDYRRSSLMSGYLTVARNTFGGALMLGKHLAVDVYASLSSKLTGGADTVPLSKALGRLTGYTMAAMTMFTEAARTFREAENYKSGAASVASLAWESAVQKTGGTKPLAVSWQGNVVEKAAYLQAKAVFSANTLIDGLMRNFGFYGEVYSRAATEASELGLMPGSKRALDYMQSRVQNLAEADIKAGNATAENVTFSGEAGPILQKVYATLEQWRYAKAIVPFIGVPGKMLEAGSRLGPFAGLVKSWREDVAAGGERAARAHAEAAIGRMAWATTAKLYLDGNLTGYGPAEPEKRSVWLMTHQPFSVKLNGEWYNYGQTLQPIGPMLGLVADVMQLTDMMTDEEKDRIPKAAFLAFKNVVGNATMLQGLADFFSVFTDESSLVKFTRNFTASNLPAVGMLGNIGAATDPYQREVNGLLDTIRYRVPGVREGLPEKIDPLGNKISEVDRLAGVVPARSVKVNDDKVASEAARLGIGFKKIPDYLDLPVGKDKRGNPGRVELTPDERQMWAEATGKMAASILEGSVNAPDWDTLPDSTQRVIMQSAFSRAREFGSKNVLTPERLAVEQERISGVIEKRLRPKDQTREQQQ